MFNWLDRMKIPFVKSNEVKFLLIFGLLFRAVLFAMYFTISKWPDSWSFMEMSTYLTKFDLSGYTGERSPGYPLLIALAFGSMRITVIYQLIIGVFTWIIVYKLLQKLKFTNKNALWITLYLQTLLYIFFYETTILVETFVVFLMAIMSYIIADDYFEKNDRKLEWLFSFILGYLVLTKPFYVFIPFVIYGFSVLYHFSWKRIISQKIIILLFPLIAYFGWSYVNKLNTGYFVSTTYFGLNISQNCVYFAENGPKEYDWIIQPYVEAREEKIYKGEDVAMSVWLANKYSYQYKYPYFPDCSYHLGEYAKETIKNNQYDYWKQVITKSWVDFWGVWNPWHFEEIKLGKPIFKWVWSAQKVTIYFFKWTFLLLVPYYIFQFFRRKKITFEIVFTTIIFANSWLQAIVIYGNNNRFAYPYEFLMIIIVLLFFKKEVRLPKRLSTFLQ